MATISENLVLRDNFSAAFTNFIRLAEQASSAVIDMRGSLNNIETTTARAALATEQLAQRMSQTSRQADNTGNSISGLMGKVKGLVASYVGLQTVTGLGNLSDTFVQIAARIDMINDGLHTTQELLQMLYQSAQNSRGSFTETADMVSKLGILAGNAFNGTEEIIAFAELLNKQMAISQTGTQARQAAMLQLTQAMSSGVLRGEELNSLLEQTPMIAQTIADYLGVSVGEMRNLASEGAITAEIMKNSMFWAADEINKKYEQVPMTWADVWNSFNNTATMALQPVLNGINWMANNIEIVAPLVLGLTGAFAVFLIAANWVNICTAATSLLATVQRMAAAVTATAWGWPLIIIVALIGVFFAAVAAVNHFAGTSVSAVGIIVGVFAALFAFVYNTVIVNLYNGFALFANFIANVFTNPVAAVKVLFYDMAATVLGYISNIAHAIENLINAIPGVQVSITSGLDGLVNNLKSASASVKAESGYKEYFKPMEYKDLTSAFQSGYSAGSDFSFGRLFGGSGAGASFPSVGSAADLLGDIGKNTGKTAGNTSALADAVDMTNEDLQMLVDMAERQYVAQVNLTSQAPVINITGQNTGNTAEDRAAMADAIKRVLLEQRASGTYRAYARV